MNLTDALLLTRHWRDTPQGVELSFWAASADGPCKILYPAQEAVCFIERSHSIEPLHTAKVKRKPLSLTTLEGEPVDGLYFSQQRDLNRLRDQLDDTAHYLHESDIKATDRFLMERFINLGLSAEGESTQREGYREMLSPRLKPSDTIPPLSYLSLDIETNAHTGEILSIAYAGQGVEAVHMQGRADEWSGTEGITWHDDERTLLSGFFGAFSARDPDLILGWNLINFDLNHIESRCRHHKLPFSIGRGNEAAAILQPQQSGQPRIASIPGRVALDGIDHLKAAFWSFESFELGHVAAELLGRRKLIENSEQKVSEILRLFRDDRPALAAYNLEDCRLVEAIFNKTDLLDFIVQRSAMTGLPLGRQGGSVAAFDNLYLPQLHRAGAVARDIGANIPTLSSPGGFVLDSTPGLYDNVLVLDFKSLYPSIIRTFRIDPLGLHRPGEHPIEGFYGARFSRTEGILPEIITHLWHLRDGAKRDQNGSLSQAIKIIMNSFYGVLGSSGCRFFDPRLAGSITRRGHEIINRSRDWIEQQGYRVIYGDTDSVFILLGEGYSQTRAQETGTRLARELNHWWDSEIERQFDLKSALEIEFETHFIRFLMPTVRGGEAGSKKRYAGYVATQDGGFRLVFKGLESVRSDWTPLSKRFQQELYRRVFFNQPYIEYIKQTVEHLRSGRLDHELVYRKRIRRPLSEYRKNIPPHVQAAKKLGGRHRWIEYCMTDCGPEPMAKVEGRLDYEHYIQKQLAPVADTILYFLDESFERITDEQLSLF